MHKAISKYFATVKSPYEIFFMISRYNAMGLNILNTLGSSRCRNKQIAVTLGPFIKDVINQWGGGLPKNYFTYKTYFVKKI